jgi:hypothetical protein
MFGYRAPINIFPCISAMVLSMDLVWYVPLFAPIDSTLAWLKFACEYLHLPHPYVRFSLLLSNGAQYKSGVVGFPFSFMKFLFSHSDICLSRPLPMETLLQPGVVPTAPAIRFAPPPLMQHLSHILRSTSLHLH